MRTRTTVVYWIASLMLMVHGPLLALGGGAGVGGFHGGSIGNAGHVTNPAYYPGGCCYGYAMGPTTIDGDEDPNASRGGSAAPVAGTGTGGGPPEELQDGRGIHVRQHAISEEGATWDSDWWAQDPRSEEEIAAAAARAEANEGAVVASLPRFYDTLYANNSRYFYAKGNFYQQVDSGYRVVSPPPGIEVQQIPGDAQMIKVQGQQYFVYNDIYYQALYSGSGIVYKVVEEPNL